MDYQFLQLEQQNQVATVWINRAELHNAFNTQVIEELHACFQSLNQRDDVRVVILAGRGKSFCGCRSELDETGRSGLTGRQ